MKNKKTIIRTIIAAAVLIAAIIGWREYEILSNYEKTDDAQVDGDISPVLPKVSGYVAKIFFEDNQPVKKGDTLIVLDDADLKIKAEQARIALEGAKANLEVTRTNVHTAGSSYGAANANIKAAEARYWKASQDFERMEKMLAEKSVTKQQYDAAKAEKDMAWALLEAARSQGSVVGSQEMTAEQQIKVAETVVSQRQADLDFALLQLSYAVILSPADGIVSKKNVEVGQLVQASQPLCSVVSNKHLWVVANFKETQLDKMKAGQEVNISVDAFKGHDISGKVASFSSATGSRFSLLPPDNASGNFVKVVQRIPVKIELDTANPIYKNLKPGMSVNVSVRITAERNG